MPLLETKGAGSAQGFGLSLGSAEAVYIEDVFSTYLYTGNGSTQTITNGIDLSGEGGLVWLKGRSGSTQHALYDTVRGATKELVSNSTPAETTQATGLTAFSDTGFSIGALAKLNTNTATYVSWTFRKAEKFFDVVTYTGTGTAQNITHNLGSTPACIIVKSTDQNSSWYVYHQNLTDPDQYYLNINSTNGEAGPVSIIWGADPTDTTFTVDTVDDVNRSGFNFVAYLFASDAGGFGESGEDNVISCGSFTTDGAGAATVTLGYEPQWILIKPTSSTGGWIMYDNMRGWSLTSQNYLLANSSTSELSSATNGNPTATGFYASNLQVSVTYIYIAIRRGPMKVPTSGTEVFDARYGANTANEFFDIGFDADLLFSRDTVTATQNNFWGARLTGQQQASQHLIWSNATTAEPATSGRGYFGAKSGGYYYEDVRTSLSYALKRATGFFDVVCYTGTGANATWTHNLQSVPEMMIVKKRNGTANWAVYHSALGAAGYAILNTTAASTASSTFWQSTTPTSTSFYTGTNGNVGDSGLTYIAYLFATCPGVSKVGSYTGTGTTQVINCGFTAGARFILIKRTDSTGDWYVWDSARGIVAGNDPYLLLNSTAAEVTSTDYIDTAATGFEISSTAPAAINASAGTFIFLAIA